MPNHASARRVARKYLEASGLRSPKDLRYQAVFLMGGPGSGKSFILRKKYLKYLPGGPATGVQDAGELERLLKRTLTEEDRGLSELEWARAVSSVQKSLKAAGSAIEIRLTEAGDSVEITLVFKDADRETIPRADWKKVLPPYLYDQVKDLEHHTFATPKKEPASYYRIQDPDLYKLETPGYNPDRPYEIHEISVAMARTYLESVLETGDPVVVDRTGAGLADMEHSMKLARSLGYRISIVWIHVPLVIAQLRNATRDRKVNPGVVSDIWERVKMNYPKLKRLADLSKVVDNTNDAGDRKTWKSDGEQVDAFFREKTGRGLFEYVLRTTGDSASERQAIRKLLF